MTGQCPYVVRQILIIKMKRIRYMAGCISSIRRLCIQIQKSGGFLPLK